MPPTRTPCPTPQYERMNKMDKRQLPDLQEEIIENPAVVVGHTQTEVIFSEEDIPNIYYLETPQPELFEIGTVQDSSVLTDVSNAPPDILKRIMKKVGENE